jgi:hypothetical protein
MKTLRKRVVWTIWAMAATVATTAAARADEAWEIFPPDPMVFLAIHDVQGMRDGVAQSPAAKVWAEPTLEPLKKALAQSVETIQGLVAQHGDATKLTRTLAVADVVCQGLADVDEAFWAFYAPENGDVSPGPFDPKVYLAVRTGGEAYERLEQTAFADGLCAEESLPAPWRVVDERVQDLLDAAEDAHERASLSQLPNGGALLRLTVHKSELALALGEGALFFSTEPDWPAAAAQGAPIEGGTDPMVDVLGDRADEPGLVVYEDIHRLMDFMGSVEGRMQQKLAEVEDSPEGRKRSERRTQELAKMRMILEVYDRMGIGSMGALLFRYTAGPDGFRGEMELSIEGEPKGVLATGDNRPFAIGAWVPANVVGAYETHIAPIHDQWATIREAIQAIGGLEWTTKADSILARIQTRSGIDLEGAVLSNLGGEVLAWSASPAANVPMQLPPSLLAVSARKPSALADAVDSLATLAPQTLAIATQEHEFEGGTCRTIGSALFPMIAPAYGEIDGMFALASSAQAFEMGVAARKAGGDPDSRQAIEEAVTAAGLPFEGIELTFSDPRPGIESAPASGAALSMVAPMMMIGAAQSAGPEGVQAVQTAMGEISKIGLALSQVDPEPLTAHLFPAVAVSRWEDDRMVYERLSPLPDDLLKGVIGGVVGAVVAHHAVELFKKRAEAAQDETRPTRVRERPLNAVRSCQENLMKLDGAKEQWALDAGKKAGETPDWSDLVGPQLYLKKKPQCPSGGVYMLNPIGEEYPICSVPDHVLP